LRAGPANWCPGDASGKQKKSNRKQKDAPFLSEEVNCFERFLELGSIRHTHVRPHHPQAMGKVGAVNKLEGADGVAALELVLQWFHQHAKT